MNNKGLRLIVFLSLCVTIILMSCATKDKGKQSESNTKPTSAKSFQNEYFKVLYPSDWVCDTLQNEMDPIDPNRPWLTSKSVRIAMRREFDDKSWLRVVIQRSSLDFVFKDFDSPAKFRDMILQSTMPDFNAIIIDRNDSCNFKTLPCASMQLSFKMPDSGERIRSHSMSVFAFNSRYMIYVQWSETNDDATNMARLEEANVAILENIEFYDFNDEYEEQRIANGIR